MAQNRYIFLPPNSLDSPTQDTSILNTAKSTSNFVLQEGVWLWRISGGYLQEIWDSCFIYCLLNYTRNSSHNSLMERNRDRSITCRMCKTSSEVDNHVVRLASVESVCSNVGITLKDLPILIRNRGSLCGVIYLNLEAFHRLGRLWISEVHLSPKQS